MFQKTCRKIEIFRCSNCNTQAVGQPGTALCTHNYAFSAQGRVRPLSRPGIMKADQCEISKAFSYIKAYFAQAVENPSRRPAVIAQVSRI